MYWLKARARNDEPLPVRTMGHLVSEPSLLAACAGASCKAMTDSAALSLQVGRRASRKREQRTFTGTA